MTCSLFVSQMLIRAFRGLEMFSSYSDWVFEMFWGVLIGKVIALIRLKSCMTRSDTFMQTQVHYH